MQHHCQGWGVFLSNPGNWLQNSSLWIPGHLHTLTLFQIYQRACSSDLCLNRSNLIINFACGFYVKVTRVTDMFNYHHWGGASCGSECIGGYPLRGSVVQSQSPPCCMSKCPWARYWAHKKKAVPAVCEWCILENSLHINVYECVWMGEWQKLYCKESYKYGAFTIILI